MNKAFCVLPWHQLNISIDGTAKLCCRAATPVSDEKGRPMRLDDTPFESIWNSDYMAAVRKDMLEGTPRADCSACYEHEAKMQTSMRIESNESWLEGLTPSQRQASFLQLKTTSETSRHVVGHSPYRLHLWFGNQCNLKCRMCSAGVSTRIAGTSRSQGASPSSSRRSSRCCRR
jgi:hypothetical protein